MPPGAHDIYDEMELVSALGKLIVANIDVARWIVKIDDEHSGRGIAYVDVTDIEMVILLRKERRETVEGVATGLGRISRRRHPSALFATCSLP